MTPYSESNISPRLRRSQPTSTQADQIIGGDWEVERQTPDSSNMEVGNGMRKTDQCEDNGKLGKNDQSQQKSRKVYGIVGCIFLSCHVLVSE